MKMGNYLLVAVVHARALEHTRALTVTFVPCLLFPKAYERFCG